MNEPTPNPETETKQFEFVNDANDVGGSLHTITKALDTLMGYVRTDSKVMKISMSVTSEPSGECPDFSKMSSTEISEIINGLKKTSNELNIPITTARQVPPRVPTFEESISFRKTICDLISKVEKKKGIDETRKLEITHTITREYNRRSHGAGCMLRSKDEWESWVNRTVEMTDLLVAGHITFCLFEQRIKEESQ